MCQGALRPGGLLPVILAVFRLAHEGRAVPPVVGRRSEVTRKMNRKTKGLDGHVQAVVHAWASGPSKAS
jgi:hypothetical protein